MNSRKATGTLGKMLADINQQSLALTRKRMTAANKIADMLLENGMSLNQFAKLMGKSEVEVSDWLSGNCHFTKNMLKEIKEKLTPSKSLVYENF